MLRPPQANPSGTGCGGAVPVALPVLPAPLQAGSTIPVLPLHPAASRVLQWCGCLHILKHCLSVVTARRG